MPRGPRGEKRPADVIGAAIMVGRIATFRWLWQICHSPFEADALPLRPNALSSLRRAASGDQHEGINFRLRRIGGACNVWSSRGGRSCDQGAGRAGAIRNSAI